MLISMKTGKTVAFGASLMLLASCSLSELTAETENNIEDASVMAANMLEKAALPDTPEVIDTVRTKSEIWLGNTSSKISEGEPLPARFETENAVTLVTNQELGLFEVDPSLTRVKQQLPLPRQNKSRVGTAHPKHPCQRAVFALYG